MWRLLQHSDVMRLTHTLVTCVITSVLAQHRVHPSASTYTEVATFRISKEEGKCSLIITTAMSAEILEKKGVKIRST
jgi:hypothetical protein